MTVAPGPYHSLILIFFPTGSKRTCQWHTSWFCLIISFKVHSPLVGEFVKLNVGKSLVIHENRVTNIRCCYNEVIEVNFLPGGFIVAKSWARTRFLFGRNPWKLINGVLYCTASLTNEEAVPGPFEAPTCWQGELPSHSVKRLSSQNRRSMTLFTVPSSQTRKIFFELTQQGGDFLTFLSKPRAKTTQYSGKVTSQSHTSRALSTSVILMLSNIDCVFFLLSLRVTFSRKNFPPKYTELCGRGRGD
jgi:hypothetical protein